MKVLVLSTELLDGLVKLFNGRKRGEHLPDQGLYQQFRGVNHRPIGHQRQAFSNGREALLGGLLAGRMVLAKELLQSRRASPLDRRQLRPALQKLADQGRANIREPVEDLWEVALQSRRQAVAQARTIIHQAPPMFDQVS